MSRDQGGVSTSPSFSVREELVGHVCRVGESMGLGLQIALSVLSCPWPWRLQGLCGELSNAMASCAPNLELTAHPPSPQETLASPVCLPLPSLEPFASSPAHPPLPQHSCMAHLPSQTPVLAAMSSHRHGPLLAGDHPGSRLLLVCHSTNLEPFTLP